MKYVPIIFWGGLIVAWAYFEVRASVAIEPTVKERVYRVLRSESNMFRVVSSGVIATSDTLTNAQRGGALLGLMAEYEKGDTPGESFSNAWESSAIGRAILRRGTRRVLSLRKEIEGEKIATLEELESGIPE